MEGLAEFSGNLQAELLNVRESLRQNLITEAEALSKIRAIRRRARSGNAGERRDSRLHFRRRVFTREEAVRIASQSFDATYETCSTVFCNSGGLQPDSK